MIPAAAVAGFLLAVFPLVATPGASLTLLARAVGRHGRGGAVPVVLGTVTGLFVHASLAVAGLSQLVMRSSEGFEVCRVAGAAYLVVLGVRCWIPASRRTGGKEDPDAATATATATAPARAADSTRAPLPALATYRQAVLANVLNPKAASIFLTLVPQFVDPARPMAGQVLILAAAQSVLVALWLFGWSFPVARAARRSGSAAARRFWTRVSGAVLVGLGLRSAMA